jgi:hypothetical protein
VVFWGLIDVLEVRYEWSFCSWAVRSKPAATCIPHSYLDPNSGSLQKPVGGRSVLPLPDANSMLKTRTHLEPNRKCIQKRGRGGLYQTAQQNAEDKTAKNYRKQTQTQKRIAGCWLVGLGDIMRGRRESVLKSVSPNLSTQLVFQFFVSLLLAYRALKASNHLLYIDNMSSETLGFRSSNICLKSPIVKDLG